MVLKWWYPVLTTVLPGAVIPVSLAMIFNELFLSERWINQPLHGLIEGMGSFAALMLAFFIIIMRQNNQLRPEYIWVATTLIGMGLLDGFHAGVEPGKNFVWLHCIATFIGGLTFSLVLLPERFAKLAHVQFAPYLMAIFSILLGIISIVFPAWIPEMISNGDFSIYAKLLNIIGALGFLLAWIHFSWQDELKNQHERVLLANHCLLFAIAGLLFHFSTIWDSTWWLWHVLRMIAYLVILWFFLDIYHRNIRALRMAHDTNIKAHQELELLTNEQEEMIQQRTQDLAEKIKELDFQKSSLDKHAIVSIADRFGNIVYANELFCHTSGYARNELLGKNHRILNSGLHPKEFFIEMWQTISNGKVWHGNIRNRRKDGRFYWVNATIVPFLDKHAKPFQYIAIRTDITERINAERAADKANQAKSEFLSSMSHELRTPMNAIIGFAQLLEMDDSLSDKQNDNVGEILKAGHHLLELINEVLDLAKIESGKISLSLEPVAVRAIFSECVQLIQPLCEQDNIQVNVVGDITNDDITVQADPVRLKQVLLNLLSNAIKYNRQGGNVVLSGFSLNKQYYRIVVTDNGKGIAKDKQDELFKPFNRLDAEHSLIEGTGIGLCISKKLIEMMDGSIGFESQQNIGSSFWLNLPFSEKDKYLSASKPGNVEQDISPKAESSQDYTVLYVEDNPANLKLVQKALELRQNIKFLSAHTARLGIELAMVHRPKLILLDINLPGMDGYQVLEVFQASSLLKECPVVAVTANAMPSDIEKGIAAGFADYLTKPLNLEKLHATLDRLLQNVQK